MQHDLRQQVFRPRIIRILLENELNILDSNLVKTLIQGLNSQHVLIIQLLRDLGRLRAAPLPQSGLIPAQSAKR